MKKKPNNSLSIYKMTSCIYPTSIGGYLHKRSAVIMSICFSSFFSVNAISEDACTAVKGDQTTGFSSKSANNGSSPTSYLQNAQVTCSTSTTVDVGTGGSSGYSVGISNPNISRDSSVVERWSNSGNELNRTIGITVNPETVLTANANSGLNRPIMYARGGYYRNYSNQGDGESTQGNNYYNINSVLNVKLINAGTVTNLVTSTSETGSLINGPASMGVDFGDMPVSVMVENTGTLNSESGNAIYVLNSQTVPKFTTFFGYTFESGYNYLPLSGYKFSQNNIYEINNTGIINQTGESDNNSGLDGAITVALAAAKRININNTGEINAVDNGINAIISEYVTESTINNSGTINSSAANGINLEMRTVSSSGVGTSTATNYVPSLTIVPVLTSLTNSGIINAAEDGVYNTGTIGILNNYGTITGHSYSIDTSSGIVTNGINNYGTLNGDINIGSNTLNILKESASINNEPIVNGNITGSAGSVINIGNISNITSFSNTNTNYASVDTINIVKGSKLSLNNNSTWQATSNNENAINISGTYISNGNTILDGNTYNNGTIILNPTPTSAGNTLTINGNFIGAEGSLSAGAILGNDDSLTDKLIITGKASGHTYVSVANENGSGAKTLEGIELITTGESTSDAFLQSGRIVAGSYDYYLRKGNASGENINNWYLTSLYTPRPGNPNESTGTQPAVPVPVPETGPTQPTPPPLPEASPTAPDEIPHNKVRIWRPEIASYTANLAAANTLFAMTLHDRLGETQYTDALTGEKKITSMWMRSVGGHQQFSMSDGQNKTMSNRYILQIGGDVAQWSTDRVNRFHLGLMGGYGNEKNHSNNKISGYSSTGQVNGYSAGIYGTWYQNEKNKSGLYVDSWAIYNFFNNKVKGDELPVEKYKSKGITASAETGYTLPVHSWFTERGIVNDFYIQPQFQITYFGVKADDHIEANGTNVRDNGNNIFQTRLGTRFYLTGKSKLDQDKVREFEPFIETNWLYNSRQYGTKMADISDNRTGSRNLGEIKIGVEGKISNNINIWTVISHDIGGSSYHYTQGTLGLKYLF
ncbi:autotransporter outer membrane beta-barrel domain-containing protein [Pluralibacter gergoviae]|uniref:autotransporter outer membrane beta-barrel domain-containing protein n=1 Tax=Pluralibacter gergoviae TaxID=61647 RepID=UPI000B27A62B|nr:autotransporter outer membrane beta-barrel domain-containing protein [Pluralibacter gergoviae]